MSLTVKLCHLTIEPKVNGCQEKYFLFTPILFVLSRLSWANKADQNIFPVWEKPKSFYAARQKQRSLCFKRCKYDLLQNFPTPQVRESTQVFVLMLSTFSEPNKPVSSESSVAPPLGWSKLTRRFAPKTRDLNCKLQSQNQAQRLWPGLHWKPHQRQTTKCLATVP